MLSENIFQEASMCHTLCKMQEMQIQIRPVSCPQAVCKQVGEVANQLAVSVHFDTGYRKTAQVTEEVYR